MYAVSWWNVSVLTWVLFWCLFPSLLHNSGNKNQNNPLVSVETVRHSSAYIILYASLYKRLETEQINAHLKSYMYTPRQK